MSAVEGADAPANCPTCQDYATRLAEAFSARDMSKHTDLKVEHGKHLGEVHPDWANRDATLYGPRRPYTNDYNPNGPGSAFMWTGRQN